MYTPASFAESDAARLHDFMRRHSFAVLTSHGEGGLFASHLPLLLEAESGPPQPVRTSAPASAPVSATANGPSRPGGLTASRP